MNAGSATTTFTCRPSRQDRGTVFLGGLKRELVPILRRLIRRGEVSYSSPPMSDPLTPSRIAQHESIPHTSEQHPTAAASTSSSIHMPGLPIAAPRQEPRLYNSIRPHTHADRPPGHASPMQPMQPHTGLDRDRAPAHELETSQNEPPTATSRVGRKAKAHVASACINCKRAHLSCDVSRPCARCVASGKQDSCVDVQHKKRGRPRLREEGEFKVEQMHPVAGPSNATPTAIDHHMRPIAATRHRRAESFRSLRSQGSESSGVGVSPTYSIPRPTNTTQPTFGFQPPPAPNITPGGYEIPTAYLDLDLIIIKANSSFRQIMLGGQEVARRHLRDIAAPADGQDFQTIRNRLRAEREGREPLYMPPIILRGHDPLLGALEADVNQYTRGFDDHTYTWTHTQAGSSGQNFPARVRLAKASSYFVSVTLPSFRPVEPPSQSTYARRPETQNVPRSVPPEVSPRAGFVPYPRPTFPPPLPASRSSQSVQNTPPQVYQSGHPSVQVPQPSPQQGYVQQGYAQQGYAQQDYASLRSTPLSATRLHVAEPPTDTTAFTPRASSRELPQVAPVDSSVQLPPILGSGTPRRQFSAAAAAGSGELQRPPLQGDVSNDDDREAAGGNGQPSPRKRRRMDIDQVLH
ncbi:uncharacterized protein RCC_09823 [Ramularia collo-cygni]|uniref:Zn(2)-C6 fungal-type domain-containing protein n=1 Tax=Ramularia collo-cygni TaxID=112498 RepID=A0A2D3V3Z9_9PEZI|nr:uncharacterized protein RCC_09823 [Ramularia collo-cygni]CZT24106.1 uncharacterized protein RCC_09823 [Ramularia collo-cygni]